MPLRLEDKKVLVAEVNSVAAEAHSAVAAEYSGLTVEQMTTLRKEARNAGVYLRVVKNTLARRALEGTDFELLVKETYPESFRKRIANDRSKKALTKV